MEFVRKIMLAALPLIFCSCKTILPASLAEIKPLPREVVVEKKTEYEPVYAVMKVLEVSEENGVQKYLLAKMDGDVKEITVGVYGEIAADTSFEPVLGTFKVLGIQGGFIRCSIETLTHKIPSNSFVRIQIGQKAKGEEV